MADPPVVYRVEPINIHSALKFIARHHSHLSAPCGGKFAMAAWRGTECVCVALIGRAVARILDQQGVVELTRTACIAGNRGACSAIVRAAGREAVARGHKRVVSYTILG